VAINTKKYIENGLNIKTKDSEIIPFIFNDPQDIVYETLRKRYEAGGLRWAIVLKARQEGISTLTSALGFKGAATRPNFSGAVVAHEDKATANLFEMYKLFYNKLPEDMKPEILRSNAYELNFNNPDGTGLNSRLICFTAGGKGIGRSFTLNFLHVSELSRWPGDKKATLNGLLVAVSTEDKDSIVIIESTALGFDHFKELWDAAEAGENDLLPIFLAWYQLKTYRRPVPKGFKLTYEEEELKNLYHLDDEQIAWRRYTIRNKCGNDLDMFKQEFPSNPEEAFLSTGSCVFNKEQIVKQIQRVRTIKKESIGFYEFDKVYETPNSAIISDIKWVEDERGYITIYEKPIIEETNGKTRKAPYVIGGDTSGEGSDYFTAKVINNITKQTVAVLRKQRMDEDLFSDQLYCLGMYYNIALIAIETNFSTVPNRELEKLHYPNLYIRERMDTLSNVMVKAIGFETNSKTKPVICQGLIKLMREDPTIEVDITTLKEMLYFIKDDKGHYHAEEGYHDDTVMATAICHFASSQQSSLWEEEKIEEKGFIERNFNMKQPKGRPIEW